MPLRDRLVPNRFAGRRPSQPAFRSPQGQAPTELNSRVSDPRLYRGTTEPHSELAGRTMIICVRGELEPFARVLAVGSGSWAKRLTSG